MTWKVWGVSTCYRIGSRCDGDALLVHAGLGYVLSKMQNPGARGSAWQWWPDWLGRLTPPSTASFAYEQSRYLGYNVLLAIRCN
jgi:hypothetical protein